MLVRAVAAALAVWCVSGAALAAGYAEVWNPPEASGHVVSGHVTKASKHKPDAVKVKTGGRAKGGHKAVSGTHVKHVASVRHEAAHGHSAKKVAADGSVKRGAKGGMRVAATSKTHMHGTVTAQSAKPHTPAHMQAHTQLAHAKPAQGKVMHANFAPGHTARPHVIKAAAKPAVTGSAVSSAPAAPAASTSPAESANVGNIAPMGAPANPVSPATARSSSLPPIIH